MNEPGASFLGARGLNNLIGLAAAALLPLLITGCGGTSGSGSRSVSRTRSAQQPVHRSLRPGLPARPQGFPITLRDALGVRVTLARPPRRIVSLAPSVTEILFDIGAGSRVIAVTSQDNYPPPVKRLPRVGGFMNPSSEKILSFRPDLVVAARGNSGALLSSLQQLKVPVFAVDPQSVGQVEQTVLDLGKLTGFESGAQKVSDGMKRVTQRIEKTLDGAKPLTSLIEVGHNPLFVAGPNTVTGDALGLAGGRNLAPTVATGFPQISNEAVLAMNPQSLFIAETGVSAASVRARPGWNQIAAVRSGRVFTIDPDRIARPAPRIVISIEQMAKDLHPHAFSHR